MDLQEWSDRIEYVSAGYADEFALTRTADWALMKLVEEVGELAQAHLTATGQSRSRDLDADQQRAKVKAEVADVIAMAIVFAQQSGIDIEDALTAKWLRHERFHRERGFAVADAR